MGRQPFTGVKTAINLYRQGLRPVDISRRLGVSPATIYNAVTKNITPEDVEAYRAARIGRIEQLIEQQIELQLDPEVARKIAVRHGHAAIIGYGAAVDRAEGKNTGQAEITQINIQINSTSDRIEQIRAERLELEEKLKKLYGGANAVIEGQVAANNIEEHRDGDARGQTAETSGSDSAGPGAP